MGRLPFGAWSWLACARLVRSVAVLVAQGGEAWRVVRDGAKGGRADGRKGRSPTDPYLTDTVEMGLLPHPSNSKK